MGTLIKLYNILILVWSILNILIQCSEKFNEIHLTISLLCKFKIGLNNNLITPKISLSIFNNNTKISKQNKIFFKVTK